MTLLLVGTVKLLLSLGADPGLNGKWGKLSGTPREFAEKKNFDDIASILEEYENLSEYSDSDEDDDEAESNFSNMEDLIDKLEFKKKKLLRDLRNLDSELQKLKKRLDLEEENEKVGKGSKTTCPVCMNIPRHKVFSCVECDSILCNSCQTKVESCPSCRISFAEWRPKRNRWAEKLIKLENKDFD